MSPARIFISYRRDDSAGFARAIGDALAQRLGADKVFIDVDDIGAGQAFDRAIADAVGSARVLLVLIGRRWLEIPVGSARPRLEEPDDFVRHEISTGLARGLQVIPLLVDGAPMPAEADLPEPIRPLARRQALVIDHARFAADLERLVTLLRSTLGEESSAEPTAPRPVAKGRRPALLAFGAAIVAALGAAGWFASRGLGPPGTSATRVSAARPPVNGRWIAEVVYPWPNARYVEQFSFLGEGDAVLGTASFLRIERGIVDGRIDADGRLEFTTRTQEQAGGDGALRELTHRYRGRLEGDALRLVLQTEGSSSPRGPVEVTARRASP
jgi:hypothetical protein